MTLIFVLMTVLDLKLVHATNQLAEIPFMTFTFGKNDDYSLQMRALLNKTNPEIEMIACFPNGTWFGLGFGGTLMTNTELVFFMGCTTQSSQKVISVRSKKSDRPK